MKPKKPTIKSVMKEAQKLIEQMERLEREAGGSIDFAKLGREGGKLSASRMTKAERTARAKKAAAASVKVRQAKAKSKKRREQTP
ncbi:MAG: hypothetical protein WBP73_04120 [Terriglobales bacterium]